MAGVLVPRTKPKMPFSRLLLCRRLARYPPLVQSPISPCFSSLSAAPAPDSSPQPPSVPKPSSLSARMSFIFDQIDEIDKKRDEKDETLQRIRAWRESKKPQVSPAAVDSAAPEDDSMEELKSELEKSEELLVNGGARKEVELVHPWPEWIELMERLVQQNYFDDRRKDEEGMIKGLGFDLPGDTENTTPDFTRDFNTVRTAVINFGRDRFDLLRALPRQDLQVLVGYGCPTADKRVAFSAKLLRKRVHLDEGDVCSSCSLRNSCERAYLLTSKEEEAQTIDVMRVLFAYGFDPHDKSLNQSILKQKSMKTVVRKLLRDVVRLSAVPIDPNLPRPVIKKPPPKVKQPPPPPRKRIGRSDVEMKKGDWLCTKCDFLNFAKNTMCLQCDAKRPKRQLLPGEWECPQCNFLNYRRNTVCFHCEHKRPLDTYTENQFPEKQYGPRINAEKVDRKDISNAWNFDFDDDESDGADVAAFEYADSQKLDEDFPLGKHNLRDDGTESARRPQRDYSDSRHDVGFNDFDDDDDDIDNYELVDQSEARKVSRADFSNIEADSGHEDNWHSRGKTQSTRQGRKPMHRKNFDDSDDDGVNFDTDDDLPAHPDWKSSHVADNKRQNIGRRAMKFVSDDDLGFDSDTDDENIGFRKGVNHRDSNEKQHRTSGGRSSFKSESLSDDGRRYRSPNQRRSGFKSKSFSDDDRSHRSPKPRRSSFDSNSFSDDDRSYGSPKPRRSNYKSESFSNDDRGPKQRKESGRNPRGRSGMTSSDKNRGFNRSGTQGRSNNNYRNQSGSYLDDERYQRPRVNVR